MAEVERTRNEVIYKREITTDEPNAHAELILKVDGLPEEALDILRKKFNALAEMVEREVREKTSWQQVTSLQVLSHSVQIQWKKEHHTAQQLKCAPVLLPGLNRRIF
jgi:hypothetical protein